METLFKSLIVIVVLFMAARFYSSYRKTHADPAGSKTAAAASAHASAVLAASPNGFVSLPSPYPAPKDAVLILAAENCPGDAAQRADSLARGLRNEGIPCTRSSEISLIPTEETTEADIARLNEIMLGALPIVFVNGRVRNNPSIGEIEAEYGFPKR